MRRWVKKPLVMFILKVLKLPKQTKPMAYKDKQSRTIVLKISEADYDTFMQDLAYAHQYLKSAYQQHAELFPSGFANSYAFNGKSRKSKKQGIQMRKVKLAGNSYRLRPCFLLPHMRGTTKQVAKPLFLLRFGVPFWALAFVFGGNAMYWYRAFLSLSDFSLLGTTIHHQDKLPEDLLADEHHVRVKGQKAYIATTISQGCILGAEACRKADEENLQKGYAIFKQEALELKPDYQPATVNTDGWWATQKTWRTLFSSIFIIECFLHAFLQVRDRATKKLEDYFSKLPIKCGKFIGLLPNAVCPSAYAN